MESILDLTFNTLALAVLALLGASCSSNSRLQDEDLKGTWVVRKVESYNNGKESVFYPVKSGEGGYAGTVDNPAVLVFTKHGEVVLGGSLKSSGDRVLSYKLKGDSLDLSPFNSIYIGKISTDTLVTASEIEINYYDKSVPHGKWILTFYHTR